MSNVSRRISREDLYQLVWAKPTRELAKEFGISDVAVGKICKKLKVPKPPSGYWQRIAAGYKVKTPLLAPSTKGQPIEITIWPTIQNSNAEPQDPALLELIEREKLPGNRIAISENLRGAHRLVSYTNKVLGKAKPDSYGRLILPWNAKVERPYLDLRVSKQALHRSLRIVDALLRAIEARGHQIEKDGIRLAVNGEQIRFYIKEKVDRTEREPTAAEKERSWHYDKWVFTPTGELTFTIDEVWVDRKNWRDRKNKPLENQLNDIVVGIISAAEVIRVKRLEREAELRRWREEELRRQEMALRQQLHRELVAELETECKLWLESRKLKQFLQACENSLSKAGRLSTDSDESRWLQWARSHADRIDPLRSGGLNRVIQNHHNACVR